MKNENIIGRRRLLAGYLSEGTLDSRVVDLLVPSGQPIKDEDYFWDFKSELPIQASNPTPDQKDIYTAKMAEVVKDAVSFYNTYGGYLVVGVDDSTYEVTGFNHNFDVNDLCKKILGATRETVDVKYRLVRVDVAGGSTKTLGVLYIPRRPNVTDPVQFVKDAREHKATGRKAYMANEIYMRSREECRPAKTAADYALLFKRELYGSLSTDHSIKYIENNLPARDPNLLNFVGREEQLDSLWAWFVDRYTAVKLLSGPGGVGKTSLAWTFCDAVSRNAPTGLEKVIWLTAKKRTYAAIAGSYIDITHTHFSDLDTLLKALLGELGVPENEIDEDISRQELIDECITALIVWPCLLIVDDIDSLENEEQYEVFRTISTIFDRVIAKGGSRARALLTARLNLGAAPGQLMQINGLPLNDFTNYVEEIATAINAPIGIGSNRLPDIKRLHVASSGSPLFAASILRLVSLGVSLSSAISQYKGADGLDVRRFAFEKEINGLSDSQLRVLFAALNLKNCTITNLISAVHSNRSAVIDDISGLRNYHLMTINSTAENFLKEDPVISVSAELHSMTDLIRKRLADPSRIETNCAKINRSMAEQDSGVSKLISKVIGYWSELDYNRATETAEYAAKQHPENGDLWCLLGRAYLTGDNIQAKKADAALRKAADLSCTRTELRSFRIKAKESIGDWMGIVQLFQDTNPSSSSDVVTLAKAYQSLGSDQASAGSWMNAEGYYRNGFMVIQEAFRKQKAHGNVEALRSLKTDLGVAFVEAATHRVRVDDDKIEIWNAFETTWKMEVRHRGTSLKGIAAALAWGEAVDRRRKVDERTISKIENLVSSMQLIAESCSRLGESWTLVVNRFDIAVKNLLSIIDAQKTQLAKSG